MENKPSLAYSVITAARVAAGLAIPDSEPALAWGQINEALLDGSLVVDPEERHCQAQVPGYTTRKKAIGSPMNALQGMLLFRNTALTDHAALHSVEMGNGWEEMALTAATLFRQGHALTGPGIPEHILGVAISIGGADLIREYLKSPGARSPEALNDIVVPHGLRNKLPLLCMAAISGNRDILDQLLRYGLDPEVTDEKGNTLAFYACTPAIIAELKKHSVDVSSKNNNGKTAEEAMADLGLTASTRAQLKTAWEKHFPREISQDQALRDLLPRLLTLTKTELDRELRVHKIKGTEEVDGVSLLEAIGVAAMENPQGNMTPQAMLSLWKRGNPERTGKSGFTDAQLLYAASLGMTYGKLFESTPFTESPSTAATQALPLSERIDAICEMGLYAGLASPFNIAAKVLQGEVPKDHTNISAWISLFEQTTRARANGSTILEACASDRSIAYTFWNGIMGAVTKSASFYEHLLKNGGSVLVEALLVYMSKQNARQFELPDWFPGEGPKTQVLVSGQYFDTTKAAAALFSHLWARGERPRDKQKWMTHQFEDENLPAVRRIKTAIASEVLEQSVAPATPQAARNRM